MKTSLVLAFALFVVILAGPSLAAPRLADAASPYLRQHADDAIDWHPWGPEALELAKRENKLIYLSIGYATCHWCHVMARTTFRDKDVIELLARDYISILVDREERPDLDRYFMDILLAMNGVAGWPGNFFLTPDLTPLFSGSYLPPKPEPGTPGFLQVGRYLAVAWGEQRPSLLSNVATIQGQLAELTQATNLRSGTLAIDPREAVATHWSARFDSEFGGFGQSAKFPRPQVLSRLLRHGVIRKDGKLLAQVYRTLDHMAAGALRDQLGGAFHRYTQDRKWHTPHFEVTLEDNALMARLYVEAYQVSGRPRYAAVARAVLDDLLSRFSLAGGGFASALDADSGEIEGGYYTWTDDEVSDVLGRDANAFIAAYLPLDDEPAADRKILRLMGDAKTLVVVETRLAASIAKMRAARSRRAALSRDEKVVTAWNAMAVSAFAHAARILQNPRYLRVAQNLMVFIGGKKDDPMRLSRIKRAEAVGDVVFLDDYAFVTQALIDLYETDFDLAHLERARTYMDELMQRFRSTAGAALLFTPRAQSSPIPSATVVREDVAPSGNAAALIALRRLALFTAEPARTRQAQSLADDLARLLGDAIHSAPGLAEAWDFAPAEAFEIVIVGPADDAGTHALLAEVRRRLLPGTVIALLDPAHPVDAERWLLLAKRPMIDGRATAFVCRSWICKLPVNTVDELAGQLDALRS